MNDYSSELAQVKNTNGYVMIGRGGATMHYITPGGCDCRQQCGDNVKKQAIKLGVPVIDSRLCAFADVAEIAIKGPIISLGRIDTEPYSALSLVSLAYVANLYRAIGADIHNV